MTVDVSSAPVTSQYQDEWSSGEFIQKRIGFFV